MSHDNQPLKRAKKDTSKKGKKVDKKRQRTSDNEDGSDSHPERDPDSDDECGIPLKDLKGVGCTIARCCDLFCDVNKAVNLVKLSRQQEQLKSDSEDEDEHQAKKEALDHIPPRVLAHYKKVYSTLTRELPMIKVLIEDPSCASTLKIVLKKINEAMSKTRSSDSARLCKKLPAYILQNPKVDTMQPPINSSTSKSELGLNHPQISGYLCPVESVAAFKENAKETHKKLENGKIKMSHGELPAFLWEDNGVKYDKDDMHSGLLCGFYVERVARHIFTGPSTAHSGDSHGVRSSNAALHQMEKVEAAHIAYAAVLAHFGITSQLHWSPKDGCFNYRKFYYILMDIINECKDANWKEELLKHYNMLFFKNEEGRDAGFANADSDESASTESFLSRLEAQAAMRAAFNSMKPSAAPGQSIPTPPRTSPSPPTGGDVVMPESQEAGRSLMTNLSSDIAPQSAQEAVPSTSMTMSAVTSQDAHPRAFASFDSDLSNLEPEPESVMLATTVTAKKSFVSKGKRSIGGGETDKGGSSKRKSSRKKGKNA